jgi:hypothetical protein
VHTSEWRRDENVGEDIDAGSKSTVATLRPDLGFVCRGCTRRPARSEFTGRQSLSFRNLPENAARSALDILSKWEPINLTISALPGGA